MADALICDLDNVLSDTKKFHSAAESEVFQRYCGLKISPQELIRRFSGMSLAVMLDTLIGEYHDLAITVEEFRNKKDPILLEMAEGNIRPMPGALELIDRVGAHMPLGLASSSSQESITLVLESLRIADRFGTIVSGQQIAETKPDPAIFIRAAENLGFIDNDRTRCAVLEDSVAGAIAAERARMRCIVFQQRIYWGEYPMSAIKTERLDTVTVELIKGL